MSKDTRPLIGIDASRANVAARTGIEWYAYNVIQELKSVIPSTVRVALYSREPLRDGLEVLPPNWESRVLDWPPRFLWTQARLSWEMLVRAPDMLFVPAHVIPFLLPRRTVTTVHDVAFVVEPQAYGDGGRAYLRFATAYAISRAELITVSEFSKKEIVERFNAAPECVAVTPLGFDASRYRPVPHDEAARVAAKYDIHDPYFLFVGRLERKKNLAGLLRAFHAYKERQGAQDRTALVLVGKRGRGFAEAMDAIKGCEAEGFVHELGYVPVDDLPYLYAGATAFVFPSWYEGFGLPVIEAFACGVPVIASGVASLPEIAGEAALYVDPANPESIADAMGRLRDDADLRGRLIEEGLLRASRFTWRRTAELTWITLERTLKQ
jgi:glycosyltransferase involved in cell wall biosynthesis